jgi:hypothetical protein
MTTITLQTTAPRRAPRLARPIAEGLVTLIKKLAGWLGPRPVTRAEEASELRQLALRFHGQPSFAADLIAAADRHAQESE